MAITSESVQKNEDYTDLDPGPDTTMTEIQNKPLEYIDAGM